ncbi:citrate synthase-lysine N-methyltransferase CSKMT, mitochondrial-like [Haliotis rufescens]|uniref:citrate synthase-lysine N-methyltransferase CSKMT, mitochondrial-like n=1 Tax=Haliotis rufescens TaxID=6454 RepID=UPI00201F9D35|nr:citrate synthase-lysine N-methyltransferase CSKMT, mitochondrial-like [Haliotis rufescens]
MLVLQRTAQLISCYFHSARFCPEHFIAVSRRVCSSVASDEKLSRWSYWSSRYRLASHRDTPFDWFLSGETLYPALLTHLRRLSRTHHTLRIMDAGCGNSDVPCCLYTHCVEVPIELHLVDYVSEALHTQKAWLRDRQKGHPATSVHCVECDVTRLPYRPNTFHLVVDKGTTDALLKDPVDGVRRSHKLVSSMVDVLHPGGVFVHVTDEDPDSRHGLLEEAVRGTGSVFTFSELTAGNHEYFMFQYIKESLVQ